MVSPSIATHGPVVCHPLWVFFGCLVIHSPPHRRPREWVYPCSTRRNEDKVSEPPWQRWAERYIVYIYIRVCVCARAKACMFMYRALLLQPERSCAHRSAGWWWCDGGGELGADTFLLTITSHTRTHIPTSWSTVVVLLPPQAQRWGQQCSRLYSDLGELRFYVFFYEDVYSKPYWLWVLLLETSLKLNTYIKAGKDWQLDRILE